MNVQHVGVRVFALYRNVAGRVASFFLHDAEAVHAGHLGRRLSAAQPGEQPTHLVHQVVWETSKQKDETRLSKAVLHFKVVIIFPHLYLLNEPKQGLNETVGNGLSFYKMPTCNPQIGRTRNITGNKLTDVGAVSLIDGRWR